MQVSGLERGQASALLCLSFLLQQHGKHSFLIPEVCQHVLGYPSSFFSFPLCYRWGERAATLWCAKAKQRGNGGYRRYMNMLCAKRRTSSYTAVYGREI